MFCRCREAHDESLITKFGVDTTDPRKNEPLMLRVCLFASSFKIFPTSGRMISSSTSVVSGPWSRLPVFDCKVWRSIGDGMPCTLAGTSVRVRSSNRANDHPPPDHRNETLKYLRPVKKGFAGIYLSTKVQNRSLKSLNSHVGQTKCFIDFRTRPLTIV